MRLGYDSKHEDYKVVCLAQASHDDEVFTSEVAIYSVNSNSWKRSADFPYLVSSYRWGVYLKDALHTVVERGENSDVLMAFNLETEEHRELPMPPFQGDGVASVEVLEGRLVAVVPWGNTTWIIWLLEEEEWVELMRLDAPTQRYQDVRPLAYSKSGEEVLLGYEGEYVLSLNCYSLNDGAKVFTFPNTVFDAHFYVETLVSPFTPAPTPTPSPVEAENKGEEEQSHEKRDDFLSIGFKLKL